MWVVLHGYGQLAERFIGQFVGLAGPQRSIIAPEALNRFYVDLPQPGGPPAHERRVGAAWMTFQDRDAEIADYVAYLDRVVRELVPDAKLTVFGFSQGVATASRWAALGTVPVHRLILWAGTLPTDLEWSRLATRMGSTSIEIVLGDRDKFIRPDQLERELGTLRNADLRYQLIRHPGGHSIDAGVLARLAVA